jgi:hypothetical protein
VELEPQRRHQLGPAQRRWAVRAAALVLDVRRPPPR